MVEILGFISLICIVALSFVMYIFISNTQLRLDQLDRHTRMKDKLLQNNLRNVAIDANYNDQYLEKQINKSIVPEAYTSNILF